MNTKYIFISIILFLFLSCSKEETENNINDIQLYPISVNDNWGFIDKTGTVIIKPKYEYAWNFSEGLAAVQVNNKWGFIDRFDKMVIPPIYDSAYGFVSGVAYVEQGDKKFYINRKGKHFKDVDTIKKKKNKKLARLIDKNYYKYGYDSKTVLIPFRQGDKFGYKNKFGQIVITPKYQLATDYHEGFATVWIDNKAGLINTKGEIVIEPKFESIYPFINGMAPVKFDGLWGYIDKQGDIVIDPKFSLASIFDENGIAHVVTEKKKGFINKDGDWEFLLNPKYSCFFTLSNFHEGFSIIDGSRLRGYGFIDRTGKIVLEPNNEFVRQFSEGLAAVKKNGKVGFINENGIFVIEPQYDHSYIFSNGLAFVKLGDRYGYINKQGDIVIEPKYNKAGIFSDGLASVEIEEDKYCYIDKDGDFITEDRFKSASKFSEGLAAVAFEWGKYGYIDRFGEFVIEPQFQRVRNFSDGLAQVWIDKQCGYINKIGKLVIDAVYTECREFSNGVAAVRYEGKSIYINNKGIKIAAIHSIVPFKYNEGLVPFTESDFIYNRKWGYMDVNGDVVLEPKYYQALEFSEGLACVETRGKTGYINTKGEWIWKPTR